MDHLYFIFSSHSQSFVMISSVLLLQFLPCIAVSPSRPAWPARDLESSWYLSNSLIPGTPGATGTLASVGCSGFSRRWKQCNEKQDNRNNGQVHVRMLQYENGNYSMRIIVITTIMKLIMIMIMVINLLSRELLDALLTEELMIFYAKYDIKN